MADRFDKAPLDSRTPIPDAESENAAWEADVARRREEAGLPPLPTLPPPGTPTLAEFMAEVRELRTEWVQGPDDEDSRYWAGPHLDILWRRARQIPNMPPPPRLTIGVRQPVRDMQEALGALDDLLGWCEPPKGYKAPGGRRAKGKGAPKRSWTQPDLDAEVKKEIAKYPEMLASARRGSKGAKTEVRKTLGRNAIAKRLGVRAQKMVSKCPDWIQLADEFGMRRKGTKVPRSTKVGFAIAEETAAVAAGDTTEADVTRRETLQRINEAMLQANRRTRQTLEQLADEVARGQRSDEEARTLVETYTEQQQDSRSRRILDSP